jgi:hypothetical protein
MAMLMIPSPARAVSNAVYVTLDHDLPFAFSHLFVGPSSWSNCALHRHLAAAAPDDDDDDDDDDDLYHKCILMPLGVLHFGEAHRLLCVRYNPDLPRLQEARGFLRHGWVENLCRITVGRENKPSGKAMAVQHHHFWARFPDLIYTSLQSRSVIVRAKVT